MSTNEGPVYEEIGMSTDEDFVARVSTHNTCPQIDLLLSTDEDPTVIFNRLQFFRLMVERGVYGEYPSAARVAAE